jgi:Ca2+-binding EF-hand superfamily protein
MHMRVNKTTLLAAILVGASWMAHAEPANTDAASKLQELEQRFKAANKAGDGKLTLEEAKAGMPLIGKNFNKIDKDHKGYVTMADIKAALAAQGK